MKIETRSHRSPDNVIFYLHHRTRVWCLTLRGIAWWRIWRNSHKLWSWLPLFLHQIYKWRYPGNAHYENMPIQIYWKFYHQKIKKIQIKNSDIFHTSAQNIDCGYSLEPPRRNPFFFWAKIRKIMYTPVNPSFTIQKWDLRGSKLYRSVFVMRRRDEE